MTLMLEPTIDTEDEINSSTRLVGLMGGPMAPWSSPIIYNAAFRACDLNWRYVPLPVFPGKLREAVLGMRALGFAGAELAAPYQSKVLNYLEELSPDAELVGAVKYIQVDEQGRLVGYNTCWLSFLGMLRTLVPSLNGLRPLVIGAGHAARSVVYALARQGLPVTIVNPRMDEAVDLVHRMRHVMDEHSFSVYRWPLDVRRVAREVNLVINATSMGAWPDTHASAWPASVPFPSNALAFDLVSWPSDTRFLRQARASGARTVGGLTLLVYGAALAIEQWTGEVPPIDLMWLTAERVLSQHMSWEELTYPVCDVPQPT